MSVSFEHVRIAQGVEQFPKNFPIACQTLPCDPSDLVSREKTLNTQPVDAKGAHCA
jgi:hypothetical protein